MTSSVSSMPFSPKTTLAPKRSNRRSKSCTECRRRKQKCVEGKQGQHGLCVNCSRRFPPVECIGRPPPLPPSRADALCVAFSSMPKEFGSDDTKRNTTVQSPPSSGDQSTVECDISVKNEENAAFEEVEFLCMDTAQTCPPIGSMRLLGGVLTGVNCTNVLSVNASHRNSELFHLFHQRVAPFMFALAPEGQNVPAAFQDQVLPEMMQSLLMPHIAIFTASAYRAHTSGIEILTHTPTMALKGPLLHHINQFLEEDFDTFHQQLIQSVLHLIIIEWYSYDLFSLNAHMKGLREMIKLRGGIEALQSPLLRQLLILTDYELACGFERDLYLQQADHLSEISMAGSYPESYASPLVEFATSFCDIHKQLDLNCAAASILDDIRSLTLSIVGISSNTNDRQAALIQSSASQIQSKLASLRSVSLPATTSSDNIYSVIYLTALAFTSCVSSGHPFIGAYTRSERSNLYTHINLVPLKTWKRIPGIYLWILLVASPGISFQAPVLVKSHVRATTLYISFTNFGLAVGCLRAFWGVVMWIRGLEKWGSGEEEAMEMVG